MKEILKKVTWVHTVAGMVAAVLAVAISWQTLGWDTVAMSSEVAEVQEYAKIEIAQAQGVEKGNNVTQQILIDSLLLDRLYDQRDKHRNNIAGARYRLEEHPNDPIALERVINIQSDMDRIQAKINRMEGVAPPQ